jgi:hypothetical protein
VDETRLGVGVGVPGEPDSDETDEDWMDMDSKVIEDGDKEDMGVDALAARMTIVLRRPRGHHVFRYVLGPRSCRPILV